MTYWFGAHDDSIAYRRAQGQRKQADEQPQKPFYMDLPTTRPPGYNRYPLGAAQNTGAHTVTAGDTFERIGGLYGVTADELRAANPEVQANKLRLGTVLKVPQSTRARLSTNGFDPEATTHVPLRVIQPQLAQESMFNPSAMNGKTAYGIYQVQQNRLDDAKKLDSRIKDWTLDDMLDPYKARYVHHILMQAAQLDYQYKNGKRFGENDDAMWWRAWNQPYAMNSKQADNYAKQVSGRWNAGGYHNAFWKFLKRYPDFFQQLPANQGM